MSVEVSVMIEYICDECGRTHSYDISETISDDGIRDHIICEGWEFKDGKLYCEDCKGDDAKRRFVDRCYNCTRHLGSINWHNVPYCPHYKMDCDDRYEELWLDEDVLPDCPAYLPIGGVKSEGPKYKPVENCSLNGFIEGLE